MTAATKIFERTLKVGEWVEIDPHKRRPSYLIEGTAWRVENFDTFNKPAK